MRISLNVLVALFPLLFLVHNNASKMKMTNVVCESYNQSFIIVNNCRLKAINRYKTVVNIEVNLRQTINKIIVHGQIFKRANGYKPWLYNSTVEGCKFYKRRYDPVVKLIFNLFKSYSSLNHTCPYYPGILRLSGFYLPAESLPVPLPSGDYLITIMWSTNKLPQLSTNVSFSFQEDF